MLHTTRVGDARKWAEYVFDAIDRFAFREPDLDALARGWEVRRGRRFARTYADPRWATVAACPGCGHRIVIETRCKNCSPVRRVPSAGSVGVP